MKLTKEQKYKLTQILRAVDSMRINSIRYRDRTSRPKKRQDTYDVNIYIDDTRTRTVKMKVDL